jgi:hypothetical protein
MKFSELRIRGISSWTIAVFGILAIIFGLIGLIQPELSLQILNFPILERSARLEGDFTIVFLTASSMASFNMGIYYLLAALTDWKPFFGWTVPFRILTFTVFCLAILRGMAPIGFIGVATWELVGALATGAALAYERREALGRE